MTDRPIIFSAPMVRALLAGRKTQTRRLATSPLAKCLPGDRLWVRENCAAEELSRPDRKRTATRKERQMLGRTHVIECDELDGTDGVRYPADGAWRKIENTPEAGEAWSAMFHYGLKGGARPSGQIGKTVPSIHMPRWASRLTLTITDVRRTETVDQISEADAIAEGIYQPNGPGWTHDVDAPDWWNDPVFAFRKLWDGLHDKPGERFSDAPTIVALTFRVALANIDRIGQ